MYLQGNFDVTSDNGTSKYNCRDGRSNCLQRNDRKPKAKKSIRSKRYTLKIYFVLICSTILLKMCSIECLSDHSSESTTTTTTTPVPSTGGEYFTSILRMKELALLEQSVVAEMYEVVKIGELRQEGLSKIKSYLFDYDSSIQPMLFETDVQTAVASHPLISYRTLRRIVFSLPDILQYNVEGQLGNVAKLAALIQPAVTGTDVIGAMEGILRLQVTFLTSPLNFAHGRLQNFDTKSGLTEMDCFLIGNMALNDMQQPSTAIEWFVQALRMLLQLDVSDSSGMILIQIVRHGLRNAIEMHNKVMSQNPWTFTKAIEKNLSDMTKDTEYELTKAIPPHQSLPSHQLFTEHQIINEINFQALCRGEKIRNGTLTKNLKCYYKTDSPFLIIKPLKVEVHSDDPLILQFYDVMPNFLINRLINNTTSDRLRSVPSKGRISSSDPVDDKNDKQFRIIPQIVYEATGHNLLPNSSSEFLIRTTYGGIGGFYGPHFDAFYETGDHLNITVEGEVDDVSMHRGDRMATIMFILSDVKLGGGTAFPKIGVLAEPVKGSAIFWYNLKKNGHRNAHMLHGGCPVLLGEKWIVNKFIRGKDQMFKRKCSLDPNE